MFYLFRGRRQFFLRESITKAYPWYIIIPSTLKAILENYKMAILSMRVQLVKCRLHVIPSCTRTYFMYTHVTCMSSPPPPPSHRHTHTTDVYTYPLMTQTHAHMHTPLGRNVPFKNSSYFLCYDMRGSIVIYSSLNPK